LNIYITSGSLRGYLLSEGFCCGHKVAPGKANEVLYLVFSSLLSKVLGLMVKKGISCLGNFRASMIVCDEFHANFLSFKMLKQKCILNENLGRKLTDAYYIRERLSGEIKCIEKLKYIM
jgi:hypothetical protein